MQVHAHHTVHNQSAQCCARLWRSHARRRGRGTRPPAPTPAQLPHSRIGAAAALHTKVPARPLAQRTRHIMSDQPRHQLLANKATSTTSTTSAMQNKGPSFLYSCRTIRGTY